MNARKPRAKPLTFWQVRRSQSAQRVPARVSSAGTLRFARPPGFYGCFAAGGMNVGPTARTGRFGSPSALAGGVTGAAAVGAGSAAEGAVMAAEGAVMAAEGGVMA